MKAFSLHNPFVKTGSLFLMIIISLSVGANYGYAQGSVAIGGGTAAGAAAQCAGLQKLISLKNKATDVTKVRAAVDSDTENELNNTKECVLDTAAIILRETLIRKMTSSIVTWINSGFEGSPAFVTNIEDFLLDSADEAFGTYIYNNSNFAHLCSPFQFDIRFSLALSYSVDAARPTCTLSDIVDNVETAIDDLSVDWDWDVYETITTDPSGNIFSSYIQSQENISNFITGTVNQDQEEINRNQGFLSFRKCTGSVDEKRYGSANSDLVGPPTAEEAKANAQECKVVTPGSVIQDTLSNQLNLGGQQLALADEFNEIVGALMGQLAQQAFGRDGVAGLSERSGGSNSFLSQYGQDANAAGSDFAANLAGGETNSDQAYVQYIATQNESIQTLLQAKIKVSEAFACYNSKYNTYIDADGQVLSEQEVNAADPDTLARATFTNILNYDPQDIFNGIVPQFLTPSQSLLKAQEYQAIITRIDTDLVAAEANIEQAQDAAEITAQYQSRLNTSGGALDTQAAYAEYSRAISSINIDQTFAQAGQQNILTYTDQAVNGTVSFTVDGQTRTGGATNDLATCQTFNQVVSPQVI